MLKNIFICVCLSLLPLMGTAQGLETWSAYPSFSTVKSIYAHNDQFISATLGGIFITEQNEIIKELSFQDGLHSSSPSVITVDENRNILIAGYLDGYVDLIDLTDYSITPLADINRVSRFNDKSINALHVRGDTLYVGVSFGIVQYNLNSYLVLNSVHRLGDLDAGVAVNDLSFSADSIYAATEQGMAVASLGSDLAIRNNWLTYGLSSGIPSASIHKIEFFNGKTYSLIGSSVYTFENDNWSLASEFPDSILLSLTADNTGESLAVASEDSVFTLHTSGVQNRYDSGLQSTISEIQLEGDRIYIGSTYEGTMVYDRMSDQRSIYLPPGPYLNFFNQTLNDESRLIATATRSFPRTDVLNLIKGYYMYENGEWMNYNRNTRSELSGVESVYSIGMSDSSYFLGSWGSGIIEHRKSNDAIQVYDASNSSLSGITTDPEYVVISDIDTDSRQNIWAISYLSETPLNVKLNGESDWIPFNGLSGNDNYFSLLVDSFDQKWISLISNTNSGLGLLIVDTADPESESDDRYVKLTSAIDEGNLPHDKVKAMVQDKNDEIWIGTERGIARFIFPDLVIDGGPAERQAQWLINEDTTQASRFLLRDVNVSALAVNDANQKWIGSENQGIWLINEKGSKILKRLTTDNSNLISNNILSISIMRETGEVFIATDKGLISYQGIPKEPVTSMSALKVYPNPFRYDSHNRILIEGLSEISKIKIVGVDGLVLNEIDARGGRISWDGYDYNGNKLGTGIYFVVAFEQDGSEKGVGKVLIVR